MILQDILWPHKDICPIEKMYFRINDFVAQKGDSFILENGGLVSSDTYFNGLSIDKWKKYTNIKNIKLALTVQGNIIIRLLYKQLDEDDIIETTIDEKAFSFTDPQEVILDIPDAEGMVCFEMEAVDDDCALLGGRYFADIDDENLRNINIAIGICTFRREEFIEGNLNLLNKSILNNPDSELNGHLEVFISDNAQTLDIDRLSSDQIHIFKNKNAGGTSGFTRDMIEVLQNKKDFTHILLMDDDIVIEPEALLKTYRILTTLKDEYADAFIGGAMLRNDRKNIQVESGASWNAGNLISLKAGLDLTSCKACLFNETEEYYEYNAWWYCCIPMKVVTRDNLPMPLFIRGDDVEYGLRNIKTLILMNGICVWHEPFEAKYSSYLSYYILRNLFIDNALHFPEYDKKQARKRIETNIIREIMYFRYKNVDLTIHAVRDFLSGIDWLKETDGERLHKEILDEGYKTVPLEQLPMDFSEEIYKNSKVENDHGLKKMFRFATLNGYLRKPTRDNIVPMSSIRPYNAYRTRRILNYDESSQKGFITERNGKEAWRCFREMLKVVREVNRSYNKIAEEYRKRQKEVQNIDFWKSYLGIQ